MNLKYQSFFKKIGTRIAQSGKEQGIAQVQSAQTLAHLKGGRQATGSDANARWLVG